MKINFKIIYRIFLFIFLLTPSFLLAETIKIEIKISNRDYPDNLFAELRLGKLDRSMYLTETDLDTANIQFVFEVDRMDLASEICVASKSPDYIFFPSPCFNPFIASLPAGSGIISKRINFIPISEAQGELLREIRQNIDRGDWEALESARDKMVLFMDTFESLDGRSARFLYTWSNFLIASFDNNFFSIPQQLLDANCIFFKCDPNDIEYHILYSGLHDISERTLLRIRANFLNAFLRLENESFVVSRLHGSTFFDNLARYIEEMEITPNNLYLDGHWRLEFKSFCVNYWSEYCDG